MYLNIGKGAINTNNNIGDFEGCYWSSSENTNYSAWTFCFDNGNAGMYAKNFTYKIRAIRNF